MDEKELQVGDVVTYVDPVGVAHSAIITAVWTQQCVNVVYVSNDETKRDSYGRQVERDSSVQRQSEHTAHGRYFTV